MFKNKFVTIGIQSEVPTELVHLIFEEIDKLVKSGKEVDYLQVFDIKVIEPKIGLIEITHSQEVPEYEVSIFVDGVNLVEDLKIFVMDENDNATMMLAWEY